MGSALSVLAFSHIGSSLSVRDVARIGSAVSVLSVSRLGSSLSVLDYGCLGSSLSLRSFARMGASLSVLSFHHVGSSLSVRDFTRLGAAVSVLGLSRIGSVFSLSVIDLVAMGSSLSLRSFARIGSAVSVLGFNHIGASLSLRAFARVGSTLSVLANTRFGSSMSVLDFATFGSTLSVRHYVSVGSKFTVPSSGRIEFGSTTTYIQESSSNILFYASGAKAATMDSTGGTLHGTWNMETVGITSDRRLKRDIVPLKRTLTSVMEKNTGKDSELQSGVALGAKQATGDGALWLLRQLRPVSYSFRKGLESKYMRFGFIADELEMVVPDVVRTKKQEYDDQKSVIYQDLIALLTAAAQSQQAVIEDLSRKVDTMRHQLERLYDVMQVARPEDNVLNSTLASSLQV